MYQYSPKIETSKKKEKKISFFLKSFFDASIKLVIAFTRAI